MLGWSKDEEVGLERGLRVHLECVDQSILVGIGRRNSPGRKVRGGPAALVVEVPLHLTGEEVVV